MRYVALLRGINVGGHIVKMDRLRVLFEELGLNNVETFIASGNVIFDAPAKATAPLERRIEAHLHEALGYAVATHVRPLAAMADVATNHPFQGATEEGHALYVGFVAETITRESAKQLETVQTPIDFFHANDRELYWLCHKTISETKVSYKSLEKVIGMQATFRNVNTVRRLAAKSKPA